MSAAADPHGRDDALARLSAEGVSIWLDDLSRESLESGRLQHLVDEQHVVGVTTNPTIFAHALANGERYERQTAQLREQGASVAEAITALTTEDVRRAADLFAGVAASTDGEDGRVSIEVNPHSAHDTEATVAEGRSLWTLLDRPNILIKVPATEAGLEAIRRLTAAGVSVNVTLIFGLPRYREVIDAYLAGLEEARAAGRSLASIRSVASFFVSRVDTEVDRRLKAAGVPEDSPLLRSAALSNARLAYQVFEQSLQTERWRTLADAGANVQRPLWASTSTKDPALPDTAYVDGLVAPHTVNTMPLKTLDAVADHGRITGDTVRGTAEQAQRTLDEITAAGVDLAAVTDTLEVEGVHKFEVSWDELTATVTAALDRA